MLYTLKQMIRTFLPHSNNYPPDSFQQAAETVDLQEDSFFLPKDIHDNIERERQKVLEELSGRPYAERFANAVAKNLTEKALAGYRLDPNRERH